MFQPDPSLLEEGWEYRFVAMGQRLRDYDRLLSDAMRGDPLLFARQDEVNASWTIVDPILEDANATVPPYEPGTWGPKEADTLVAGLGGWHDPA